MLPAQPLTRDLHGLCRLPASRIAALVFRQERLEGDLRSAHLRLRAWAAEIALASWGPAEAAALERPLAAALCNMRRTIDMGWLLSVSTHALQYAGALLNYSCIALALLHGVLQSCAVLHMLYLKTCVSRMHTVIQSRAGDVKGGGGGAAAERISNASFAILTLVYSFTSLFNLADAVSELAGVTARVAQLLQVSPQQPPAQ